MPALHVDTAAAIQEDPPEQPELNPIPLFAEPPEDPPEDPDLDPIIMATNPLVNGGSAL